MNRLDYAFGVLDTVCKNFDKKHPKKIPYFVIYAIPVENERALFLLNRDRKRQGIIDAMTQKEYCSEFKGVSRTNRTIKSHIESVKPEGTHKTDGLGSGSKDKGKGRGSKIIQIKPTRLVTQEKIITWNYYDCLNPIYGEVHELDEMPKTSVVEIKLVKSKIDKIGLKKLYSKKVLEETPEVTMIGYKQDKPFEEKTLDEIIAEVTTGDIIPTPFVFRSGDSEVMKENINPQFVEMSEHLQIVEEERSRAASEARRQIEISFEMRGLSVAISKSNDVEIIGGSQAIKSAIETLEHNLGIGDLAREDEFSGDEFESDDEK
jgi:hypothetical protein